MTKTTDLPNGVKAKLLELAQKLPESARKGFLVKAATRLGDLALDHPNTIVFAAAGWVLGEMVDNLLSIPVPFTELVVELTADHASELGLLGGSLYGFVRDRKKDALRSEVTEIIAQELRRAMAT
jgi:hypothetical protein